MYYPPVLILSKRKLYIMKILHSFAPLFFYSAVPELVAVVLHTSLYAEGHLNNVSIM